MFVGQTAERFHKSQTDVNRSPLIMRPSVLSRDGSNLPRSLCLGLPIAAGFVMLFLPSKFPAPMTRPSYYMPESSSAQQAQRQHGTPLEPLKLPVQTLELPVIQQVQTLTDKDTKPTWMTVVGKSHYLGIYRACVPRPHGSAQTVRAIVTGGLFERSNKMTVTYCINSCGDAEFTYAGLSKGTECYCSVVKGDSPLLTYVDGSRCDIPCSGEPKYVGGGEEHMSLYRTRALDIRCSTVELKTINSLPLVAMASYPRSGNTWTRQLISQATGLMTSTIYRKEKLVLSLEIYNGTNPNYKLGQTICTKSHHFDRAHIQSFEGVVLLIRNPYRAIVAEVFRGISQSKEMGGNWSVVADQIKNKKAWTKYVTSQFKRWRTLTVNWIKYSRRVYVSHYETMETNQLDQLTGVVRFLNVTIDNERILCATQEGPSSATTGVRLGNYGTQTRQYLAFDPFPAKFQKRFRGYIEEVNLTLQEYHLPALPWSIDEHLSYF